jgi:hypothetical protein
MVELNELIKVIWMRFFALKIILTRATIT